MSSITEAIKKRKKEVGQEKVEELVPVSLDEPRVEVPRTNGSRRLALLAIVLLVAGVAVSAVVLFPEMFGEKPEAGKGSPGARIASLPKPGGEAVTPAGEPEEALPLPERPAEPVGMRPEGVPGPSEAPMSPEQPAPGGSSPAAESLPKEPTAPLASAGTAPGLTGSVSEPATSLQGDPFAGITLQGIVRFNPSEPEVLISGKALKVGEFFKDIRVVEIGTDSVKLRCGNIERVIRY